MLLSVSHVSRMFADEIILEDVSFQLEPREKTALIGRNGCGKTTLLRIITGEMEPDTGSVMLTPGARVGYLKQIQDKDAHHSVLQEAQSGAEEQIQLNRRLEELTRLIEEAPTDDLLSEFALLHERIEESRAFAAEHTVRSVLEQMGFTPEDEDRPVSSLSGGERTRLSLARLLLEQPDLLILDEPTNHLDLDAVVWLEEWLKTYPGAVLLVSHDRVFLERTVQKVFELENHKVTTWPGGFGKYRVLKAERRAEQARVAARQAEDIAKLDEFVRRFMNSQRTAQAKGRQRLMNRLKEQQITVDKDDRSMALSMEPVARSGDQVIVCEDLAFGWDGEPLVRGLDWTVRWGERWGVIGDNGAGKSTLIKTILGLREAMGGSAKVGSRVEVGYFAQDAASLDLDRSPLEHVIYECELDTPAARNLLGRFLFEGDDVFKPIRALSGGERNKLVLAELCQLSPNLLILDEPTNHLDMDSREALIEVLRDYKGTLVLVSHDRHLLASCTTHLLDVKRSGCVVYPGGFEDYRQRQETPNISLQKNAAPAKKAEPTLSPRELSKMISKTRTEAEESESEVARVEGAIAQLEEDLAKGGDPDKIIEMSKKHRDLQADLEKAMEEWQRTHELLDSLMAQQG